MYGGGDRARKWIQRATHKARVVIGAGGGKVLDTARAVASDLSLPVVNCPTIASSDAPCSALSVVYTEAGEWEEYRIYRRNPDLVLVDTAVIAHKPRAPSRGWNGRCASDMVRGQGLRGYGREEYARRSLNAQRGGAG